MRLKLRFQPRARSAFTMIEALAIITLLTLLALTVLPALARSRPYSQSFQCLNNNRQLCAAWRTYADDNRDRMVFASGDDNSSNPLNQYAWTLTHLDSSPGNRANWDTNFDIVLRPLWPYTGHDPSIYRCPSDPSYVIVSNVPTPRVRSMSMNFFLGGFAGTTGGFPSAANYRIFVKTTDLNAPGPSKTFVFLDERWDVINWGNFFTDMSGYYPSNPSSYVFSQDFPGFIHDRGCSFSFADGRAEIHRWRDARTTPPIFSLGVPTSTPSPRNPDIAWLQDHATRPK